MTTPDQYAEGSPVNDTMPRGPGLFQLAQANGHNSITNVRRLAGRDRSPGAALIGSAAWLLVLIGAGALYVSFDAQRKYVFAVRHHQAASIIEALLLDLLMIVFTLLALGLSRAGKPSRTERALILACAAASAYMNVSAADVTSPRSVAAYVLGPLALAVVVDRVVAVIRRHVLADDEPSAWASLGRAVRITGTLAGLVLLYTLRFALAAPETARGLRRMVLDAAPLPAQPATTPPDTEAATLDAATALRAEIEAARAELHAEIEAAHAAAGGGDAGPAAVDRDALVAELADQIRDAVTSGDRWAPDYGALMDRTGYRRRWCEKAVQEARTLAFSAPDGPRTDDSAPAGTDPHHHPGRAREPVKLVGRPS